MAENQSTSTVDPGPVESEDLFDSLTSIIENLYDTVAKARGGLELLKRIEENCDEMSSARRLMGGIPSEIIEVINALDELSIRKLPETGLQATAV